MKKQILSLLLVLAMCFGLTVSGLAASDEADAAADRLHELGLFTGVGNNADGTPNYDLDRAPNRMEAVTLLVRLLGKEAEAKAGTWSTPLTDVADWAKPYVGYAYKNGLTSGTSATTFSGTDTVSATQYLTFVLRALGYSSDSDFKWDAAWELTDQLGITNGQYSADSAFTRGDAVIISATALDVKLKDGSKTLLKAIEEAMANAPKEPELSDGGSKIMTLTKDVKKVHQITAMDAKSIEGKLTATIEITSDYEATVIFDTDLSWTKEKTGYNYEMTAMIGNPEHYTQLNIGGVYNESTDENTMKAYVENPMGEVEHWDVKLLEENTVNGYIKISVTAPKSGKYNLSMIHDAINDCDISVFQHP